MGIALGSKIAHGHRMAARILLVDDDDDARGALAEALGGADVEVYTAEDGEAALRLIRTMPLQPTVVVLDLMMPVMGGISFLQHRAIDPKILAIPVIVLSSESSVADDLEGSVLAFLPKPASLRRLLELIDAVTNDPAGSAQLTRTPWHDVTGDIGRSPERVERRRTPALRRLARGSSELPAAVANSPARPESSDDEDGD